MMVVLIAFANKEKAEAPSFLVDKETKHTMPLTLTSPVFENNGFVPEMYTCDGSNISPPLTVGSIPPDTVSLVLVMDDPDIPEAVKVARGIERFDHWSVFNLPPDTTEIPEGGGLGVEGMNSAGRIGYTGPCPPTEYEPTTHRYIFRLYALARSLEFSNPPSLAEIETAAAAAATAKAELIGLYSRVRDGAEEL